MISKDNYFSVITFLVQDTNNRMFYFPGDAKYLHNGERKYFIYKKWFLKYITNKNVK